MSCRRVAVQDRDQRVARRRQRLRRRMPRIGDGLLPGASVIGDRDIEPLEPPRDRLADAAQAENAHPPPAQRRRSEEHTSELQSLMRISYAVFCLKKKKKRTKQNEKNS